MQIIGSLYFAVARREIADLLHSLDALRKVRHVATICNIMCTLLGLLSRLHPAPLHIKE
jgi:hypothetical protein